MFAGFSTTLTNHVPAQSVSNLSIADKIKEFQSLITGYVIGKKLTNDNQESIYKLTDSC